MGEIAEAFLRNCIVAGQICAETAAKVSFEVERIVLWNLAEPLRGLTVVLVAESRTSQLESGLRVSGVQARSLLQPLLLLRLVGRKKPANIAFLRIEPY